MKQLFACLFAMLSIAGSNAQRIDSASVARLSPELKEEVNQYILDAKKAHKTGMLMAIGGGAVGLVGAIMVEVAYVNDVNGLFNWNDNYNTSKYETTGNVGAALFLAGAASALGSIPFFVKVHKKRNAARAILYSNNRVSLAPNVTVPGTQSVGIGVAFNLGGGR